MTTARFGLTHIIAGIALGAISGGASADVCFADTKLDIPTDYGASLHVFGNGGTGTTTPVASGGNPGQFLQVDITVNSASPGQSAGVTQVFLRNTALYDPARIADGAIYRICYEEWVYRIQGTGQVQGTGPVLRQVDAQGNLAYYRTIPSLLVGTVGSWERRAATYVESDFVAIDPTDVLDGLDQTRNPDFSEQGQPIEFGVFRSNATTVGGGGFFRSAAMDSWSITVISECQGDANHDGTTSFQDILYVLANWGPC